MKPIYTVCNSVPLRKAGTIIYRDVQRMRAAAGVVTFDYPRKQPSTPSDVLTDNRKRVRVGQGEGDEARYNLSVQGSVDDSAEIRMAGQSVQSGSGAGVSISGMLTNVAAGVYEVYAQHKNIVYPEAQNASFLHCTVGPAVEVTPTPPINQPPLCTDPCRCGAEEGGTAPGGAAPSGGRAVRGGVRNVSQGRTSGGRDVRRTSSAREMAWSASFGVFRGQPGVPSGLLSIACYGAYQPELGRPEGLRWQHPLASWLALPEGGLAPGAMVELWEGHGIVNFLLEGSGARFFKIGASVSSETELEPVSGMSRGPGAVCGIGEALYIRASYASGAATFYELEEGRCVGYISADGYAVEAGEAYDSVAIVRAEDGTIRQIWHAWDGLADIVPGEEEGYEIRLYPASQVTAPAEAGGLYGVSGDPAKTFAIHSDDEEQILVIRERDHTLPEGYGERVTLWRWAHGAWSQQEGEGEEAVLTERVREEAGDGAESGDGEEGRYSVTVRLLKGGAMASCVREEYECGAAGHLLLSRTEGAGAPGALTTSYRYNSVGLLTGRSEPGGGVWQTIYDEQGRVREESSPWGAGLSRTVQTTYRSEAPYSAEPARVRTTFFTGSGNPQVREEVYTYSEANHVRRVEKRVTAAGASGARLSVEEHWLADAPEPFAAGRPKMIQAENGVQTHYAYAAASSYGALYSVTTETRVAGALVPGQSVRQVSYISAEGNTVREEESLLLADGVTWAKLSGATHAYDAFNRRIGTEWDNGRRVSQGLTCAGEKLWEIDADGVRTDYAYDSARQLVETTRAAVYDGDTCLTPETITEYARDAAGRVLCMTTRTGPMTVEESTQYDLLGRVVAQTDALGRVTATAYSEDGLTETVTTPAGATLTTVRHPDGSVASLGGTGQRAQTYSYDIANNRLRESVRLADGTLVSQVLRNGFGEKLVLAEATTSGYLYTRKEYNALGQLVKQYQDTGSGSAPTAATLYEYDSMGHVTKQTLALSATPTALNAPVTTWAHSAEATEEGVWQVVVQTRWNAAGNPLTSTQKTLMSRLSPTLASKRKTTDERGWTSTEWTEYTAGVKRLRQASLPTSALTALSEEADGFTLRQRDHAGVETVSTRSYTATGMRLTQTDGRGNTTTTLTDLAGRTVSVTDAAGNTTSTAYDANHDHPTLVTDAQGHTACYRYDIRGRKVAEWGSALQPALYAYDDANLLVSLTTFRSEGSNSGEAADPTGRTDGDTTTWEYHSATGLELCKTYADDTHVDKTYDAYNRLATETNARGDVTTHSYEHARGLLLATTSSDGTRSYQYNHLGQLTQVTDAAGVRSLGYNAYGEQETDSLATTTGATHLVTEARDAYGRSAGYTYAKNGVVQHTVTVSYGTDGRIATAGFDWNGLEKTFAYSYLSGSHLLNALTLPNGMSLTQAYEEHRDLLIGMYYKRGTTGVVERDYTYDTLGRPLTRRTARQGTVKEDSFSYNSRSELTAATVNGAAYSYAYDPIGNRTSAQEAADEATAYTANNLNQYTAIDDFTPEYDADGNQTLVKTATGIWNVTYNADNRPILFTRTEEDGTETQIACTYDHLGRRATKKVTVDGSITLHQRYLYRGYLQITCCDLRRSGEPCLWHITWDPTQEIATRPLGIRKDGTWYCYGWDLTKNVCEVFKTNGGIGTAYSYAPYGAITSSGSITQPLQWSSEYADTETSLTYYNYRHYNPTDGRWLSRDSIGEDGGMNLYSAFESNPLAVLDVMGERCSQNQPPLPPAPPLPTSDDDPACDCCKQYVEEGKQEYASILEDLAQKGCSVTFICRKIYPEIGGRTGLGRNSIIGFKCADIGKARNMGAFRHELQHAIDGCHGEIDDGDCLGTVCSEIRAYRMGEYKHWKKTKRLKEELRDRVKRSVQSYCVQLNNGQPLDRNFGQKFNQKFEESYDRCMEGY